MSLAIPNSVDELLQGMVRFDTVNASISGREQPERELAQWLAQVAEAWGISARWLPWSLTDAKLEEMGRATHRPSDQLLLIVPAGSASKADPNDAGGAPGILFDSHLDTVAATGMTVEPFGGVIEGDRLYGRGACDTKGTGAAALWALKRYAALPPEQRPNQVALLFSVDEEIAMTGIASFIENDLGTIGFEPALVIVGEPTMMRPVVAHNGVTRWAITTTGVAAHSAANYLGKSAIRMMNKLVTAIEAEYIAKLDIDDPLTGGAVCTITTIHGGTQVNIVPEKCTIEIDRRVAPNETSDSATQQLRRVLDDVVAGDPEVKYELTTFREAQPLSPRASEKVLPLVQRVLSEHGLPQSAMGAPFATHAGDLAAAGLPALVLGPGEPYPAHTKDEWVSLGDIRKGAEVYLSLMRADLQ